MTRFLNIRSKMALLILALVLVAGAVILQSMSLLETIERELAALDRETSSSLRANALLAETDAAMVKALAKARAAEDEGELDDISQAVGEELSRIEQALADLPFANDEILGLREEVGVFRARMERLFEARRSSMRALKRVTGGIEKLRQSADAVDSAIGTLISSELRDGVEVAESRGEFASQAANLIHLQSQAAQLRTRAEDLLRSDPSAILPILGDLDARLDNLIRTVATFGTSMEVREAALAMNEFAGQVAASGQLTDLVSSLARTSEATARALTDVNDARSAADLAAASAVEASAAYMQDRRRNVFEIEGRNRWSLAMVHSFSILVIVLLIWLITDRRIVRRIENVTEEMRRIARGDLAAEIAPDGSDEVGQMAEALAVFRANAIELRRSNEELGNFAYAASHDLRSPLRAIRNLVEWTIEDAGDDLSDEVRSNLIMIQTRADRLSKLLTDLLEYARAGSGELAVEVVHLPGIVRDIADMVDPDRRFDILFEGDRCLATLATPLRTILLNLVSNAFKHHDRDFGTIEITHEVSDKFSILTVSDDGPGIPEQYREKIFDLFQTLKSHDDVEGSGMGLAMVRKLVRELGGSIQIHSHDEDRGAKFIIAIPVCDSLLSEEAELGQGEEGVAA